MVEECEYIGSNIRLYSCKYFGLFFSKFVGNHPTENGHDHRIASKKNGDKLAKYKKYAKYNKLARH